MRTAIRAIEGTEHLHGLFLSPSLIDIAFQPILDLEDERPVGVEALARFSSGGISVPRRLQGARAAGFGTELEVLLARMALAKLPDLTPGLFLSINVSPQTLVSPAFSACLGESDIARVVFEITEHTPFPEARVLAKQMARIRERGGRLALDDVGSGFTSIRHVLALAPELIKLDRTLVKLSGYEARHRAMVGALCSFADETGTAVVAEGVETRPQLETLRGLGVALGQGYLWGHPGPLHLS
jgi:EAL domain-containing protein (putative c-di-GMP-specific phosphodiesterase class I)